MNPLVAIPPRSSRTHRAPRLAVRPKAGFALLITITLLAFLVLLLVSLAALTRVETQVANNSQQLASARQNALTALNIALGELQKYAGPDQRATARADIEATSIENGSKRWTGVWGNENNPQTGMTSKAAKLQWLVSGNHRTDFNPVDDLSIVPDSFGQITSVPAAPDFTPASAVTGVTTGASVTTAITIKGEDAALLVGPGTAGTEPGAESNYVVAPLVNIEVPASQVPGGGPSSDPVRIGRYAYWVGDEGVKARVNLVDPFVKPTDEMEAAGFSEEENSPYRLMVPQRLGVDRVTGYESFPVNDPKLRDVIDDGQVALAASTLPSEARQERFHDLTTFSQSVLADQLHSGLKRDLTYAFAREDLGEYRAVIRDPMRTLTAGAPNPLLSGVRHPGGAASVVPEATLINEQGPTWEQLRSYARMSGDLDEDGMIAPRIQTGTEQGIFPILVQARIGFGGGTVAGSPGHVRFVNHFYPVFVLANPYNVTIAKSNYRVRMHFGGEGSQAENAAPAYGLYKGGAGSPYWWMSLRKLFEGQVFELRCDDLAPGQARVFTLDADAPWVAENESNPYVMVNEWAMTRILQDTGPEYEFEESVITETLPGYPKSAGIHPVFMNNPGNTSFTWRETGQAPSLASAPSVSGTISFALLNTAGDVYQRFDNYNINGNGTSVNDYGYRSATAVFDTSAPAAYYIFRLADTGNFRPLSQADSHWSTVDLTPIQVYPYYSLANIRAPMVSMPTHFKSKGLRSTVVFSHRFANHIGASSFANWIRFPDDADPYTLDSAWVEWQGVRINSNMSSGEPSLPQAQERWAMADIPLSGVVSIGQLQHFNAGGYNDGHNFPAAASPISNENRPSANAIWRPRHVGNPNPIGNSRANPFVARHQVRSVPGGEPFHDQSYLLNRQLFDGYYFSTYPQTGPLDLSRARLANSTLVPFRDEVETNATESFRGDESSFNADDVFLSARNLIQKGAFNINSTSVEAWRAVLGALAGTVFNGETLTAPFVRSIHQTKNSTDAAEGISDDAWNGFRNLDASQLDALAVEIVKQVKQRGVAVSVADFINRKLVQNTDDGLAGPVQAAIDVAGINNAITETMQNWSGTDMEISELKLHSVFTYPEHLPTHALEGIAGWLTQADVVQALAPIMTARSDTFRIRTYGETRNPVTDEVDGRAWCEVMVQRRPDYVAAANDAVHPGYVRSPSGDSILTEANARFGRRFVVVGFRWLTPQDI